MRRTTLSLALLSGLVIATAGAELRAQNLTIDGATTTQRIDGVGVNINVNSWRDGELRAALDQLVMVEGTSLVRVIRDPMTWVSSEALIAPLHARDAATLAMVYEAPAMVDLWSTIAHLNSRGVRGSAVMLNFMGWTPTWLGGSGVFGRASYITPGKEGEWATMVASLVYYGLRVRHLDFTLLAPLNEQDHDCREGPCLSSSQYVTALAALVRELDAMGLSEIRLVGPDCAGSPEPYAGSMIGNATIAARTDHLALHNYGGATSAGMAYGTRTWWVTETAASCGNCDYAGTPSQGEWAFSAQTGDAMLGDLESGFTGLLYYDGFDSFYYHHDSLGYWGLLSYDSTAHTYATRKRFYVNAQIARFVRPGMVQVRESDTIPSLGTTVAFVDRGSGALTIVGHNGASAITINGQLNGLTPPAMLAVYVTNQMDNLRATGMVPVARSGSFTASIPADTFFTLTSYVGAAPDAGVPGDAGGEGGDAGDASAPLDVGMSGDAGAASDAGGGGQDARGMNADAGGADGGTTGPTARGCGCRAAGGSERGGRGIGLIAGAAIALVVAERRRRVR